MSNLADWSTAWRHTKTRRSVTRRVAVVGVLGAMMYGSWLVATDNFHTVLAGELYRSAQPSSAELSRYGREYGIRTVVNLRGAQPGSPWYEAEIAAAAKLGLEHRDFGISAGAILEPDEADRLIALLSQAPKPILIHCRSGSDRTGLAAALYLAAIAGVEEEEAEEQLSILYGHFSLPFTPSFPMDLSFEAMEEDLGFVGS